jgi:hypothetical protein
MKRLVSTKPADKRKTWFLSNRETKDADFIERGFGKRGIDAPYAEKSGKSFFW